MKDTPWDHGLRVTADADGLAGHAGAALLRKLADRAGLIAALGCGRKAGISPWSAVAGGGDLSGLDIDDLVDQGAFGGIGGPVLLLRRGDQLFARDWVMRG
jgi:hypothetical protein